MCPRGPRGPDRGEIVGKKRLTHNQSKKFGSDKSVNSRVIKAKLQACMYGHMLHKFIHYILATRARHPSAQILIQKVDYKSAYCCCYLNWCTSSQIVTQIMQMSLTFVVI